MYTMFKTIKIQTLKCKRCGHPWESKLERKPRQCPNCKSPAWDTERKPR